MPSAGGIGPGSPLIAGALNSNSEYHDFSDDELGSSNLFNFADSPDTLQSLESTAAISAKDHQASFLNPQQLSSTGPFPDSPNGSFPDSSSESAESTKRTGSTASKTPASTMSVPDNSDVKMEWDAGNYGAFDDDDNTFNFGSAQDASALNGGAIYGFGEQDDSFMDQSFDFESASSSPDAVSNGATNMASPGMPTIKTTSPQKQAKAPNANKSKQSHQSQQQKQPQNTHKKQNSRQSVSSSQNGNNHRSESREVSPMSTLVASHNSSPAAAFLNSPQSNSGMDFTMMNGNAMWPNKLDMTGSTIPDALPTPHGTQSMPLNQQMPAFGTPFNFTGGYELRILPTPLKSRVETQIPIKMTLSPLPPGVTKLHLPAHTISKPKLLAKPTPQPSPDTLELHVSLVCTSAMENPELKKQALERAAIQPQGFLPSLEDDETPQNGGEVRICNGCITRERKRAARKKIKKPDEEKTWSQDEERRVVVFNTQELKEWQPLSGVLDSNGRPDPVVSNRTLQVDAPMRIACYCRHHGEKLGFNVIFTIRDYQDRMIAQAMSNPIMITDDHKTHPMAQLTSQPPMSETVTSSTVPVNFGQNMDTAALMAGLQNGAFGPGPDGSNMGRGSQASYSSSVGSGKTTPTLTNASTHGRQLSRPGSPGSTGPNAKRRKGSGSRVPNDLAMTRLDTSPGPGQQQQMSSATSPFSPNSGIFPQPDNVFQAAQVNGHIPFANGPPTPNSNDQTPFFGNNRSTSMDNLAMAQLYSAPASSHPSRAPSPNSLRNGNSQAQIAQALAGSMFSTPMGVNSRVPPIIHKIIPNEGPTIGGIEVTVLGAAFFQGLEVWFGEQRATTTTFWGESSLVCLLPPSAVSGTVAVTFKHQGMPPQNFTMGKAPPTFKYIDDNEDKLIRTALSVLGHKMSGQMVDVSDLARRILTDGNSAWAGGNNGSSSAGPSGSGPAFNHTSHEHLESQLLKCLDLIDLDDSAHKTRLDLRRTTGHTMLHLACSLGYHRFVAALLARGANPDARDKGGFTPLHMAAIQSHSEIVRRLMISGADPTIRSLSGLAPADVAQSRAVLRAIRSSERQIRSRSSGGSVHSRTSSATSLRSLWEPLTRANTHDGPLSLDSGEESPEYTTGDFEDEDPDENNYLSMRRRASSLRPGAERPELESEDDDEQVVRGTAAYAAALKDQFQQQLHQIQQSMAMHLQNLTQLPQMPQMRGLPGMPALPGYQAYLQQAPFVQRMQQLMPRMGTRPGSAGSDDSSGANSPKMDSRWWDISSYMGGGTAAPPAYEDIFPQKDADEKQRSAATAAAEAEADMKCAQLYDDNTSTATTSEIRTPPKSRSPVPSVLKIGHKNAITREQQEQFLRAREQKLKQLSSDRNLFFIWIPLLLVMICAMLYSYFPGLFPFIWTSIRAVSQAGTSRVSRYISQRQQAQVVEL